MEQVELENNEKKAGRPVKRRAQKGMVVWEKKSKGALKEMTFKKKSTLAFFQTN